ncbi:hypothetical protein L6452_22468 [Arctium lappa]|uniref:Uncharacterized protein n=1 Tax=Arctium lappa TaxID=4217 RepID=A0ACB9AZ14_ARCLA|nr:hypothetical protein L6452_22468 [Arctium lappa]
MTAFSRFVNTPDNLVCLDGVTNTEEKKKGTCTSSEEEESRRAIRNEGEKSETSKALGQPVKKKKDGMESTHKQSGHQKHSKGKDVEEDFEDEDDQVEPLQLNRKRRSQTNLTPEMEGTNSDSNFEDPRITNVGIKINEIGVPEGRKKGQKKKGKENKDKPKRPVLGIRTRTSPMILQQTLYEMSDDQRKAVEEMGLGSFIGMTVDGIPSRLGYFVVKNLDTNTMEMTLNHGTIIINEETVHQILKVPIGGIDLATVEPDSQGDALATMWKKQYEKDKMRPT